MLSSSHKSQALYLLVAVTALGAAAAGIPAPPWAARGTGPTSKLEVVTYAAQVRLLLPEDIRAKLDALSNGAPAAIAALLYEARLRPAVAHASRTTPARTGNTHGSVGAALEQAKPVFLQTGRTSLWEELEKTAKTYESQWRIFYGTNTSNAAFSLERVTEMNHAMELLEELTTAIDTPGHTLDKLDRYRLAIDIPGAAMTIYWKATDLYWKRDVERAFNLMSFLAQPYNSDGFVRGSSYYFLGLISNAQGDTEKAFRAFLRVQQYPACLVFTAAAYFEAARILEMAGQHDNAIALLTVDVPTVDFQSIKCIRHSLAADICIDRADNTAAVRHAQVILRTDPTEIAVVQSKLARIPGATGIWDAVWTNLWGEGDVNAAIAAGLTNRVATFDDDLFFDALTHQWPSMAELPLAVATNRVLCNNVFKPTSRRAPLEETAARRRASNNTVSNRKEAE